MKAALICLTLLFAANQLCVSAYAGSATKKKHDTRAQFTPEQREKMAAEFRKLCKKKYGASSRLVRIDYYKRQYICAEAGY